VTIDTVASRTSAAPTGIDDVLSVIESGRALEANRVGASVASADGDGEGVGSSATVGVDEGGCGGGGAGGAGGGGGAVTIWLREGEIPRQFGIGLPS
jgi:hypothetical protein